MGKVLIATVAHEGGYYSPAKDVSKPIRIYSDRWVEDDIAAHHTGLAKRHRLTRGEFRRVRRAARTNRALGRA